MFFTNNLNKISGLPGSFLLLQRCDTDNVSVNIQRINICIESIRILIRIYVSILYAFDDKKA
jgi:hypothetical protein